jgi:hypothetical protein
LIPFEVAAIIVIGAIRWPEQIPLALPLGAVATASLWLRGRSWVDVLHARDGHASIGALVGLAALAIAVLAGTPLAEGVSGRAIEWSEHPIVRGSGSRVFAMMLFAGVSAIAMELALRGWVVERTLELAKIPVLAVLAGALAEAVVTPGDVVARIGGLAFGAGMGWMYIAGGRSAIAPVCARIVFSLGIVLLEALKLIG